MLYLSKNCVKKFSSYHVIISHVILTFQQKIKKLNQRVSFV